MKQESLLQKELKRDSGVQYRQNLIEAFRMKQEYYITSLKLYGAFPRNTVIFESFQSNYGVYLMENQLERKLLRHCLEIVRQRVPQSTLEEVDSFLEKVDFYVEKRFDKSETILSAYENAARMKKYDPYDCALPLDYDVLDEKKYQYYLERLRRR